MKHNTTTSPSIDEPTLIDGHPILSTPRTPRPHGWERDFSRGRRETTSTLHQVSCRTRFQSSPVFFDSETATQLFRIAQEAIQNAIRHGDASVIEVGLERNGRKVVLSVTDDGNGLPAAVAPASSRGMGWKIMRYRASRLGGTIEVTNAPTGRGVCVRCSFCAPALLDQ